MMISRHVYSVLLGAAVLAVLLCGDGWGQSIPEGGSIGVTGFDNVRLTLVNTYPPGPVTPSCTVRAGLEDVTPGTAGTGGTGCTIGDCPPGPPAPITVTLPPGRSASVNYSPVLAAGVRQQLRPTFSFTNIAACARLAAAFELFDNITARTTVLWPPQPIRSILGPAGLTALDAIRVNVLTPPRAYPPTPVAPASPCRVMASVFPLDSTVALAQNIFTLAPGQSAALEFSNPTPPPGTRQTVLPAVRTLSEENTCSGAVANFELYDRASAPTFAFWPPSPVREQ